MCIIATVVMVVAVVSAVMAIVAQGVRPGSANKALAWSIIATVCSVVMLVLGIIIAVNVNDLVFEWTVSPLNVFRVDWFAVPILSVVFALLTLAATIVQRVKQSRTDEPGDAVAA